MIKNIYEEKMIKTKIVVDRKVMCDVCNKEIEGENYYEVTTGHEDWGNDSIESVENFDICSNECLDVKIEEFSKEESKTKYIKIEMS